MTCLTLHNLKILIISFSQYIHHHFYVHVIPFASNTYFVEITICLIIRYLRKDAEFIHLWTLMPGLGSGVADTQ